MLWIGLTGSMGSGKSTVAKVLRAKGFPVLDADEVVQNILRPGGVAEREILSTFGREIVGPGGALDRRALGRIVFSDPVELARLEEILHPKVRDEVGRRRDELARAGSAVAFYDVPLLFEKKMEAQFDHIVVVDAPEDLRRERLKTRTGLSDEEISARFRSQLDPAIKAKRASHVIRNDGSERELAERVDSALRNLGIGLPTV